MEFKVYDKFIFDKDEYVINSVVKENIHYHSDFEKSKELVYRIRTGVVGVEFIFYINSDKVILNRDLKINLSDIDLEKIENLKINDIFKFNFNEFILKNILNVETVDSKFGKSYTLISKINDKLNYTLSLTIYSNSKDINITLLEVTELDISDFKFI